MAKRISRQVSREEERKQAEATEKLTRRAAGFLAGLYKLCELDHFAKNVRPSSRRRAMRRCRRCATTSNKTTTSVKTPK